MGEDYEPFMQAGAPTPPTHTGPCVESLDGDGEPLGYCVTCYQPTCCTDARQGDPWKTWTWHDHHSDAACDWCGRAIRPDRSRWLDVKGAERGYDPAEREDSPDRIHEPVPPAGPAVSAAEGRWRCEVHPDLTPGERFPSDGGGPYCLACPTTAKGS